VSEPAENAPGPDAPSPSSAGSHREILRSTSIIGAASVINILLGIVRVKVLAVLVGPAGVGLMGLLSRVMTTAATLAGMGLGHSGVRQIAAADGPEALARVRRALWLGSLALGVLGMTLLWLLREPLARWVFDDTTHAADVGWLGIGVFFSLVSASQTALLQGLRRIGDLARVSILGAFIGSTIGVVLVWQLGLSGIVWMLLVVPTASALFAALLVARLPRPAASALRLAELWPEWRPLFSLGLAVMAATLVTGLTQLLVRSQVTDALGLDATGHFEAAWSLSMNYIGFVLAAMAADYYPRLTAAIGDPTVANRLVNEQAEVALLLAAPVLVGIVTFAPFVTHLLYSSAFEPTIHVLRLQVIGDVFKVASWPMGFILLARGNNRLYFLTELAWNAIYFAGVSVLLPVIGLEATGIAFIAAYVAYLVVVYLAVVKLNGFRPRPRTVKFLTMTFAMTLIVASLTRVDANAAQWLGLVLTLATSFVSLRRLLELLELGGKVGRLEAILSRLQRLMVRGPRR